MPAVLIPFRSAGCEWRDRAFRFITDRYRSEHPDWDLIVGTCDGAWSKGEAIADAFAQTDDEILVLADADSYVDPDVLREAVDRVHETRWVIPHFIVRRLHINGTKRVYRGDAVHAGHTIRMAYVGLPGGGITVITRDAYERVPIDCRFRDYDDGTHGWGGEDISFGWALTTLVGPPLRLEGDRCDLWHLWHPPAAPRLRGSPQAEELVARYRSAAGDPSAMSALIEEAKKWHLHQRPTSPHSSIAP